MLRNRHASSLWVDIVSRAGPVMDGCSFSSLAEFLLHVNFLTRNPNTGAPFGHVPVTCRFGWLLPAIIGSPPYGVLQLHANIASFLSAAMAPLALILHARTGLEWGACASSSWYLYGPRMEKRAVAICITALDVSRFAHAMSTGPATEYGVLVRSRKIDI